jgi:hypothetical protein
MTASPPWKGPSPQGNGVVVGAPRQWLGLEGLVTHTHLGDHPDTR